AQVDDKQAPITSEPAIQLEVLRRTRRDFPNTNDEVLAEIKKSAPDVTQKDIDQWRDAGELQFRMIDGEPHYFKDAVANLFLLNKEAKKRQVNPEEKKKFDLNSLLEKLVKESESADGPKIYPVKHNIKYTVTIHDGHPRLKPGAKVRAWLPFPQEYQ